MKERASGPLKEPMNAKESYEAGYARKPYEKGMDEAAWCRGRWQEQADSGAYNLMPMGSEIPPDPKPPTYSKKRGKK